MENLVNDGLVKAIGVSNFSQVKLEALFGPCLRGEKAEGETDDSARPRIPPCVNQVEAHPGFRNDSLLEYCNAHRIHVTAHTCLGSGPWSGGESLLCNELVCGAAEAGGISPAHLVLQWNLNRGCSVIPRSAQPDHIRENAEIVPPSGSDAVGVEALRGLLGTDLKAFVPLDSMPQSRRVDGKAFCGPKGQCASTAALWDD